MGIWAWDCVLEDHVLVILFVATLLSDNPMQSEFACHVGPGGKSLCHICDVKGVLVQQMNCNCQWHQHLLMVQREVVQCLTQSAPVTVMATLPLVMLVPLQMDERESLNPCKRWSCVTCFIQIRSLQTRDTTIQELHSIIEEAGLIGNISKICTHKMLTGIKDTFLETFLNWMHLLYKSKSSKSEKQVALDKFKLMLPMNTKMLSPLWWI